MLTALALQAATTTDDMIRQYPAGDVWSVLGSTDSDRCFAKIEYERNGAEMSIGWDARKKTAGVMIFDNRFQSLKDGTRLFLNIYFVRGKTVDHGWGSRASVGMRTNEGKPGFAFMLEGEAALNDFARNENIAVMKGDNVVITLNLTASAQAMAALKRCGADVLARHPADPFEE